MQVTVPVNCSGCSSLIVQTRFDLKPFAHFERERESARGDSLALFVKLSHIRFSNYFISYLMKIYELYLTYSIIIISPAPDRDWDGALHVVPNLSQQARHQLEIGFLKSAFLESADQTPPSDYRPIMIGSRSIGAPLLSVYFLTNTHAHLHNITRFVIVNIFISDCNLITHFSQ